MLTNAPYCKVLPFIVKEKKNCYH